MERCMSNFKDSDQALDNNNVLPNWVVPDVYEYILFPWLLQSCQIDCKIISLVDIASSANECGAPDNTTNQRKQHWIGSSWFSNLCYVCLPHSPLWRSIFREAKLMRLAISAPESLLWVSICRKSEIPMRRQGAMNQGTSDYCNREDTNWMRAIVAANLVVVAVGGGYSEETCFLQVHLCSVVGRPH